LTHLQVDAADPGPAVMALGQAAHVDGQKRNCLVARFATRVHNLTRNKTVAY
jgi:E3 ubiquitin-protein ligase DOA10